MFHSSNICGWAARSYETVQLTRSGYTIFCTSSEYLHTQSSQLYGHSKWTCYSVSMETVSSNYSKQKRSHCETLIVSSIILPLKSLN